MSGGYDEVDAVDEFAATRRKESGWWGDQRLNYSFLLNSADLKRTLSAKSSCLSTQLDFPGVYIYVNKVDNGKIYIGSACEQSIFERQQQHLNAASHLGQQSGKFRAALSRNYNAAYWDFYALPMQWGQQNILDQERDLILRNMSYLSQYGYNTQIPGGR